MDLLLGNHSSYPRVGDPQPPPSGSGASAAAARAAIDEVIHEQEGAGLDVVTDGQVCWADPISRVMGALDGVRLGDATPYFETGTTYRQPVVIGRVRRRAPLVLDDFSVAARSARATVKAVLPGPYTLARLSKIESGPYRDVAALAHGLSEALAAEVGDLAAAGARLIQIEEPALLSHPADVRLVRQVLEAVWDARGAAQIIVATYWGDAEPLYAQLNSLPADVIAVDCASSPSLPASIGEVGAGKVLALGVIDGRGAVPAPAATPAASVARRVELMLKRYPFETVHLQPSCGLRYVPRAEARAKLSVLRDVRALLGASA